MRVCFFGSYVKNSNGIPSGNGGDLLKKILETQNVEVVECHEPIDKLLFFITAYMKLFFKHLKIRYDIMVIPWRGILTLPLAKLVCRKPIVYFPAFSIYDTLVNDRKKIQKNSLKARLIHVVDGLACKMANSIILESTEEINYFVNEFSLPKEKFHQLPLSADETIFVPLPIKKREAIFNVLFFGTFIPLHGIDTIINAAVLLRSHQDICFIICGNGQVKAEIESLMQKNNLENVKLLGLVSREVLLENLRNSDVCLGIFGKTTKSYKVLTNKAYQILASQKPLITMESLVAKETHLQNNRNCMLVTPCPKELAEAILYLKNNPDKSNEIAMAGYRTFVEHMSMRKTGEKLVGYIEELW